MRRHWPYVAVTAVIAAVAAVWAIPHLNDGGPGSKYAGSYAPLSSLTDAAGTHVWVHGNDLLGVSLATHVDSLAAQVMLLAVGVGLLVQIYSTAYLGHHPRYRSYALVIVLFLLAMLTVVVADDFFVLLIGWEVMGLCSYLLIGHEWQTPEARSGAAKAFLMTRIADLGLLVGILVIGQTYGTYRISEVLAADPENATAIGLLLLVAVVGKSAQFPLHTWLPDAMPGPTPITALIHAATMVAAGVYLIARLLPIFSASQLVMSLLAIIAAITMLLGALFALAQTDLKRALAWSTVSQLAFMFAALAAGDRGAATNHLLSHGAFKALLFLGCGCLMRAVGSSSLSAMGGLRRSMPVTFWSMTIGFAALVGVVPTAGFFSKDGVLHALRQAADGSGVLPDVVGEIVFYVALATSFVTAAYATRLWLVAFFGPSEVEPVEAKEHREAPRAMTGPVVVLAGATVALSIGQPFHAGIGLLSTAVAAAGIGMVVWAWRSQGHLEVDAPLLARGLDLDEPYARWIPALVGSAARMVVVVDRDGVDLYPRSSATVAQLASRALDLLQSRNAQRYATVIAAGVALLTAAAVIWSVIVTALVVPFVVGTLLMLFRGDVAGRLAALVGAAAMATSLVLFAVVWDGPAGVSGEVDTSWIKPLRAHFHVGATSLSWPFLLMTAFLGLLCCIWLVADDTSPAVVGLVLVISASSLGVFASLDLLLFFVFFEMALIPMWFLIAWWGSSDDSLSEVSDSPAGSKNGARVAATRFLLFTVSGSALLLVGIVIVAVHSKTLQIFDVSSGSVVAASLIAIGFAVKTPLVPLHTWLPDAHSKAPTVGSVLLAGVFLKLGTYGLLFLGSGMLHDPFGRVAPYLAVAGVVGIIWSALACYAQDDLKRLIAYSSIGHMGFVVLAISTQSVVGVAAAVFGSVAHGLVTGLLFFLAGSLKERFGTASMAAIGRGLYARTPWLAVAFVFGAVASLGLPGLAGFWGELLSLRSAYEVGDVLTKSGAWTLLGFAVLGIALTTAYFVRAIRLLAHGEPVPHAEDRDLAGHEIVVSVVLAASIVVLGVAPGLIVGLYDTAVIR